MIMKNNEDGNLTDNTRDAGEVLFNDYLLNEIRSQEDSAKQLVSVNSVLIGIYIAFMANSLTLEAARMLLLFMPYPKYSVYIVLAPIASWCISIIYCCRVLNPKVEISKLLINKEKRLNHLNDITNFKYNLIKKSYWFLGLGLLIIAIIAAFAIPYQLSGIAETLKTNGDAYFEQGKYDEAIQAYTKAIEINPKYAEAWYCKGSVLYNQRMYDDALRCFDSAVDLNPNYGDAWIGKGSVIYSQGNYDKGLQYYDTAEKLKPGWKFEIEECPLINITDLIFKNRTLPKNATFRLKQESGIDGRPTAVNLSYNLIRGESWVHLPNSIIDQDDLGRTKGLNFSYKGGGSPKTLELKLVYSEDGKETTFVYRWPEKTSSDKWVNMTVLYYTQPDKFGEIWPSGDKSKRPSDFDASNLISVDFAVSGVYARHKYGSGWLVLDNIRGMILPT
jgi:tetratricopeptide (TPR) repeat protein